MPGLADTLRFIVDHPLNRGRPLPALWRFASWQVRSRLARGPVVHQWVDGAKFYVRRGETGLTGNIYCGLHEYADMSFILHAAGHDDLFVDVGANAGSYTLLACAARGARGVAIEPVPETFGRLVANLELNGLGDRVRAENVGVGAEAGELEFTAGRDCMNHVVAAGETYPGPKVAVPIRTMDDLLGGESATLLKIDVEGYEALVLQGAQAALANPSLRAVIMEINGSEARYGFDEASLFGTMMDLGYRSFRYDPMERRLSEERSRAVTAGNQLFIKDLPIVADRVRGSTTVEIFGRRF